MSDLITNQEVLSIGTKKCLVCYTKTGKIRNDTLYWHTDSEEHSIWTWCNRCDRGYSINEYCAKAGLSLKEFLKQDFSFKEAPPNEVQRMDWPKNFIPLFSEQAKDGIEYLASRGLIPDESLYYDTWRKGIVFPYFFDTVFCGAQVRLIEPWVDPDGEIRKIDTIPGTRTGLLFFNYNQTTLMPHIKNLIVTEGALNAIAIKQTLDAVYGELTNPWKCIAASGSGASSHHLEVLKELKDHGYKIVAAPDSDKAGLKMLKKMQAADCITHYNLTMDDAYDWNDIASSMVPTEFVKWFLSNIKTV
jgi:hypothetical protein